MTAYLLVFILAVGIPFLLYCLWNFARELKPHRSGVVVSSALTQADMLRTVPKSQFRSRPQIVSLRNEGRAAS